MFFFILASPRKFICIFIFKWARCGPEYIFILQILARSFFFYKNEKPPPLPTKNKIKLSVTNGFTKMLQIINIILSLGLYYTAYNVASMRDIVLAIIHKWNPVNQCEILSLIPVENLAQTKQFHDSFILMSNFDLYVKKWPIACEVKITGMCGELETLTWNYPL